MRQKRPKAVVVGVGSEHGLGAGLCRRFAEGGHHVLVVGRTGARVERVARAIRDRRCAATPVVADATVEGEIIALFDRAMREDEESGPADLVALNVGNNRPLDFRTMEADVFESFWRTNTLAGFLVGREAARRFAPLGRGTVLFTGATGSLRSMPKFVHFAASKAGLRAVAQSMARELGPFGVHVAHVVIDGAIDGERIRTAFPEIATVRGEDGLLQIDAIAEEYWRLHRQPRSAWTFELDLRPYKETF